MKNLINEHRRINLLIKIPFKFKETISFEASLVHIFAGLSLKLSFKYLWQSKVFFINCNWHLTNFEFNKSQNITCDSEDWIHTLTKMPLTKPSLFYKVSLTFWRILTWTRPQIFHMFQRIQLFHKLLNIFESILWRR